MRRGFFASIGVLSLVASSTALAVFDSCDAFGYLQGAFALTAGDARVGGLAQNDFVGRSIAIGDFNGDSLDDVAIGADGVDTNGNNAGAVFVFFGPVGAEGALTPSLADVAIYGSAANDAAGYSLANLGDTDGDFIDDLAIGSLPTATATNKKGVAWVVAGRASWSSTLNLATASTAKLTGDQAGSEFGSMVSGIGDVNADGFSDLLIGSPKQDNGATLATGAAYIHYGPIAGTVATTGADVVISASQANGSFGLAAANIGDFNSDTYSDFIIGAPRQTVSGASQAGKAFIFFGGPSALTATMSAGDADVVSTGLVGDRHGSSFSKAGDFDADGYEDFWVGSKQQGSLKKGAIYLQRGSASATALTPSTAFAALVGEDANDLAGSSVVGNIDFDGDGNMDVLVGGERADGAVAQSGAAWVVHGPFTAGTTNLKAATILADRAKLNGAAFQDFAGAAVAAGDMNNDGFADAWVTAWRANGGAARSGRASMFLGGEDVQDLTTYYRDADGDTYGSASVTQASCTAPSGYVSNDDDCNDASNAIHPSAVETPTGGDANCDGFTGTGDNDGDGVAAYLDCNDNNALIKPTADEVCGDTTDNDCDGLVDDATAVDAVTYAPDGDLDGYGSTALAQLGCSQPAGLIGVVVTNGTDCDDNAAAVNPLALEKCDIIDNNCDGLADDASSIDATFWFPDADGDTYGSLAGGAKSCLQPDGWRSNSDDCDDVSQFIKPGADEVCDFADNDCDGMKYLGGPVAASSRFVRMAGNELNARMGDAVAFLADQNGDGRDEFVFAAPAEDYVKNGNTFADAGAVYVRLGQTGKGDYAANTAIGTNTYNWNTKIQATRLSSLFGETLGSGDINGDGEADLVVGARLARVPNPGQGAVYVFFGPLPAGTIVAEDADLILKGGAESDEFGTSFAIGDLDNDGYDDIVAAAAKVAPTVNDRRGRAYVFYGSDALAGDLTVADADATFTGAIANQQLGRAVSLADLNGDLKLDIVVGSLGNTTSKPGAVEIKYGTTARLSGAATFTAKIDGAGSNEQAGLALASGDANNDGYDDLVIGTSQNRAYLVYGRAANIAAGGIAATAAHRFDGGLSERAGLKVAFTGDLNEDGNDDFLISAAGFETAGDQSGASYLVYGAASYPMGTPTTNVLLANIEGEGRRVVFGNGTFTSSASNRGWIEGAKLIGQAGSSMGSAVAGGGDFDGDGTNDVAVGAASYAPTAGILQGGAAFLFRAGAYGIDTDVPVAGQATWYWDSDADTFSNDANTTFTSCEMHVPVSFRTPTAPRMRGLSAPTADLDCDDTKHTTYPGATETNGDGTDADCDGFDNRNRLPELASGSNVVITPVVAYATTPVSVAPVFTDPDGDTVTTTYVWYINGAEVVGQTTSTLPNSFFRGDIVTVDVTADDGRGTVTFSASREIQNSLPVVGTCSVLPATGGVSDDFTVSHAGLFDQDVSDAGALTVAYKWQKFFGGSWFDIPGETATVLQSCQDRNPTAGSSYGCRRGNQLRAVCTPNDGIVNGQGTPSNAITLVNAAPQIDSCTLSPAAPTTLQDITVTIAGSDVDLDPVTTSIEWLLNGSVVAGQTTSTFPNALQAHFDVIQARCSVVDDSALAGVPVTSTPVTVINTAPGAPVIDLTPNAPRSDEDLTVSITTPASDVDGDPITYSYYWTQNGSPFNNPTYPSTTTGVNNTSTVRFDTWEVTAVSNDGYTDGASDSDSVAIGNTLPVFTAAVLTPDEPTTTDDVTVSGVGWYDDDSDPEAYSVKWYVNGVLQAEQAPNPLVLGDENFVRGDEIYAELTAIDPVGSGNTITTTTITAINTAPTAPVLAITPNPPGEADDLNCTVATPSSDDDGDTVTYTYAWYRVLPSALGPLTTGVPNVLPESNTSYANTWYCTALPFDGYEDGDLGTSATIAIQDLNAPPAPTVDTPSRYHNEDEVTLSGTCVDGLNDCNAMTISCNDGVAPQTFTSDYCGATNTWSLTVGMTRGRTMTCSATCTDVDSNSSLASNSVTTEACSPFDAYDEIGGSFASTYGDAGTSPINEWAILADSNATNFSITGNVVNGDTYDWYLLRSSDNAVSDAAAGVNGYKFEIEMPTGTGTFGFTVARGAYNATADCVATAPYDDYEYFAYDNDDATNHHAAPVNRKSCAAAPAVGTPANTIAASSWAIYNECQSLAADHYVKVERLGTATESCASYNLRVYNGRP